MDRSADAAADSRLSIVSQGVSRSLRLMTAKSWVRGGPQQGPAAAGSGEAGDDLHPPAPPPLPGAHRSARPCRKCRCPRSRPWQRSSPPGRPQGPCGSGSSPLSCRWSEIPCRGSGPGPSPHRRGYPTITSQDRRARSARTVMSSQSPGPMPTTISLPKAHLPSVQRQGGGDAVPGGFFDQQALRPQQGGPLAHVVPPL